MIHQSKENLDYICETIINYLFNYYNISIDQSINPYYRYSKMVESISSDEKKKLLREVEIDILNSDSTSEIIGLGIKKERLIHLHIDNMVQNYDPNFIQPLEINKKLNHIYLRKVFNKYDDLRLFNDVVIKMLIEKIDTEILKSTIGIEEIEVSSIGELMYIIDKFDILNRGHQISGVISRDLDFQIYGHFDIGYNRILLSPEKEGVIFRHSELEISNISDFGYKDTVGIMYQGYVDILSPDNSKIINVNMNADFFR